MGAGGWCRRIDSPGSAETLSNPAAKVYTGDPMTRTQRILPHSCCLVASLGGLCPGAAGSTEQPNETGVATPPLPSLDANLLVVCQSRFCLTNSGG